MERAGGKNTSKQCLERKFRLACFMYILWLWMMNPFATGDALLSKNQIFMHVIGLSILVSFPLAVMKYSELKQLRGERVYFDWHFRGPVHHWRTKTQDSRSVTQYLQSRSRERRINLSVRALQTWSTHPVLEPLPRELFHPHGWAPLTQKSHPTDMPTDQPNSESLTDNLFQGDSTQWRWSLKLTFLTPKRKKETCSPSMPTVWAGKRGWEKY